MDCEQNNFYYCTLFFKIKHMKTAIVLTLIFLSLNALSQSTYIYMGTGIGLARVNRDIGIDKEQRGMVTSQSMLLTIGANHIIKNPNKKTEWFYGGDITGSLGSNLLNSGGLYVGKRKDNLYLYTGISYFHFGHLNKYVYPRVGAQLETVIYNYMFLYGRLEYSKISSASIGFNLSLR